MVDEIERLRGERDAALKARAELNDHSWPSAT